MKAGYLTYIFISIITFGILMASCENDNNSSVRNVEGHWLYVETKINVSASSAALKKSTEEYIAATLKNAQISYEFKNDKTYYCHRDNTDPLKGKFKMLDKNYYLLDDIRGEKRVVREDNRIIVLSDLRKEIARQLNVAEDAIIEATVTETFERGLSPN
ncbi:MAG: hypothetical protein LBL79_08445 [Prevotella sp.]|nr:hypothetical protein [Prevotella sp.]